MRRQSAASRSIQRIEFASPLLSAPELCPQLGKAEVDAATAVFGSSWPQMLDTPTVGLGAIALSSQFAPRRTAVEGLAVGPALGHTHRHDPERRFLVMFRQRRLSIRKWPFGARHIHSAGSTATYRMIFPGTVEHDASRATNRRLIRASYRGSRRRLRPPAFSGSLALWRPFAGCQAIGGALSCSPVGCS